MSRDMSAETRHYMETGEDRTKERTELFLTSSGDHNSPIAYKNPKLFDINP